MKLSAPNVPQSSPFFAWLILICIAQLMRGGGIVPPSMSVLGFWALMSFVALLLALLVKVVTAILLLMAGNMK